jgi:hypothetical protein
MKHKKRSTEQQRGAAAAKALSAFGTVETQKISEDDSKACKNAEMHQSGVKQ